MLKIYLSSILIWMIILYCTCAIFEKPIKEKGWINAENKSKDNGLKILFILSAVPIVRLFVFVMLFVMSTYTKEQFDEWCEKVKNKDE